MDTTLLTASLQAAPPDVRSSVPLASSQLPIALASCRALYRSGMLCLFCIDTNRGDWT